MLFSQTLEDRQFSFFQSLLWHVINGEDRYKDLVNPVLQDVQALVLGSKDYYAIDRDSYHVIVCLEENDADYFRQIDIMNLQAADYQHISDILTEHSQFSFT